MHWFYPSQVKARIRLIPVSHRGSDFGVMYAHKPTPNQTLICAVR